MLGFYELQEEYKRVQNELRVSNARIVELAQEIELLKNGLPFADEVKLALNDIISKDVRYRRTKKGLITRIYTMQISHSKKRGHLPPDYSKAQLSSWLYSQKLFHSLYQHWANSNFKKDFTPTCDRINDKNGYSLNNITLMSWTENKLRAEQNMRDGVLGNHRTPHRHIMQMDKQRNVLSFFVSAHDAARKTGLPQSNINKTLHAHHKTCGGFIWEFVPDGMVYDKESDSLIKKDLK